MARPVAEKADRFGSAPSGGGCARRRAGCSGSFSCHPIRRSSLRTAFSLTPRRRAISRLEYPVFLEAAHHAETLAGHPHSPAWIAPAATERRQPAVLEAPLMASQRARRAAERACHVVLVGPALLDQAHHRVRLGHAVAQRVLREHHARDDHDAVLVARAHQAAIVDHRLRRRVAPLPQRACPVDRSPPCAGTVPRRRKKADRFGSAPLELPLTQLRGFSRGYVRSSELWRLQLPSTPGAHVRLYRGAMRLPATLACALAGSPS